MLFLRVTICFATQEENKLLQAAIWEHGEKDWKTIAEEIPNRTSVQCLQHWKNVLHPDVGKGNWGKEEDEKLVQLVEQHGKKWSWIARQLPKRIGKRCRERYMNHLCPELNKSQWNLEEEQTLVRAREQLGNKVSSTLKTPIPRFIALPSCLTVAVIAISSDNSLTSVISPLLPPF